MEIKLIVSLSTFWLSISAFEFYGHEDASSESEELVSGESIPSVIRSFRWTNGDDIHVPQMEEGNRPWNFPPEVFPNHNQRHGNGRWRIRNNRRFNRRPNRKRNSSEEESSEEWEDRSRKTRNRWNNGDGNSSGRRGRHFGWNNRRNNRNSGSGRRGGNESGKGDGCTCSKDGDKDNPKKDSGANASGNGGGNNEGGYEVGRDSYNQTNRNESIGIPNSNNTGDGGDGSEQKGVNNSSNDGKNVQGGSQPNEKDSSSDGENNKVNGGSPDFNNTKEDETPGGNDEELSVHSKNKTDIDKNSDAGNGSFNGWRNVSNDERQEKNDTWINKDNGKGPNFSNDGENTGGDNESPNQSTTYPNWKNETESEGTWTTLSDEGSEAQETSTQMSPGDDTDKKEPDYDRNYTIAVSDMRLKPNQR